MPSKEEIFAKLLYLINAPAQRLVTAMGAVGRNLAVVVDQGGKENKFKKCRTGLLALSRTGREACPTSSQKIGVVRKMADINAIADQIQGLTLLEASQLVKLLEEKLGVSAAAAAPVMVAGGGAARRPLRRPKRRPSSPWF